jgi:hypothetical protein
MVAGAMVKNTMVTPPVRALAVTQTDCGSGQFAGGVKTKHVVGVDNLWEWTTCGSGQLGAGAAIRHLTHPTTPTIRPGDPPLLQNAGPRGAGDEATIRKYAEMMRTGGWRLFGIGNDRNAPEPRP